MSDFLSQIINLSPKRLALLALELHDELEAMRKAQAEPIAIAGIGCRFPGGSDGPDAYWRMLRDGVDAISEVPKDRFDIDEYYDPDPDAPGRMYSRYGGFLQHVDRFDASFFGIAPREAAQMDPQQRLLLEVAWEALEHAGQSPAALAGSRTGVFVGVCAYDYALLQLADTSRIELHTSSGAAPSILANRLSYLLDVQGPSITLDTACSSSLVSVHLACQSLRQKECDFAIAGGINLIQSPVASIALSKGRMLAADGRCKTFDAAADGYVRGEGCGAVFLMRASDALAAGHTIYGLIRGSAVNQDGYGNGLTAPNLLAQQAVIRKALENARVQPEQVGYIEAHGTGTSLGDPIEVEALCKTYGAGKRTGELCGLGSVKTNIGHLEGAAGIAGLIKAVLALHHQAIPPHLHFKQLNPNIVLGGSPFFIPGTTREWAAGAEPRFAAVSSFGFGGTNAHIILSEAPRAPRAEQPADRPLHVLALSAKSGGAVRELAARYRQQLGQGAAPIADICFTANAGRTHSSSRLAVVCESAIAAQDKLAAFAEGQMLPGVFYGEARPMGKNKVAFLFTGQGSQYAGMGRQLYETQAVFRKAIDYCDGLSRTYLPAPLLTVLYPEPGAASAIDDTALTQPVLFAVAYALTALWKSWGVTPSAVLGHSAGEYAAACAAGVFSVEDGLKLMAARGQLMQSLARNGAMAAVFAGEQEVVKAIGGLHAEVSIAALNGPAETVISGTIGGVASVLTRLQETGFKSRALNTSHAFHSALMDPILDRLENLAGSVRMDEPRIALISNLTGKAAEKGSLTQGRYWSRHARQPVRFAAGLKTLSDQGYRHFLEIGPQPVLVNAGREGLAGEDHCWYGSLRRGLEDWQQLLSSLAGLYAQGANVNWAGFDAGYSRRRVALPTYPFERQHFPAPYVSASSAADDLYELQWEPKPLIAGTTAAAGGRWLILSNGQARAEDLVQELRARGETVLVGEDLEGLATGGWDHVIHCSPPGQESVAAAALAGCASALRVVQRLAAARLWFVVFADDGEAELVAAPLAGLARVVAVEHPQLRCSLLSADANAAPASLVDELCAGDDEDQIRWRGGVRSVARLTRLPLPAACPAGFVSSQATYLITGGLGALGLEAARCLAEQGARNLVLLGRKQPSDAALERISGLEEAGVRVRVVSGDVADFEQLKAVIGQADAEGMPLRGIIHAAGVLDDGVLLQQTPERFASVFQAKVAGGWNLHQLTRNLPLDFLVFYSSMSAVLGTPGQGNYAAANAFLDALARYRRGRGLTAISVNWGPWETAGMAASLDERQQRRRAGQGISLIPVSQGSEVLGRLLACRRPQVAVFRVRWDALLAQFGDEPVPAFLRNFAVRRQQRPRVETLQDRLSRTPSATHRETARGFVREQAVRVGGLAPEQPFDDHKPFREMGLDSLMVTELARALGIAAPAVFTYSTVAALSEFLLSELQPGAAEDPVPAADARRELLLAEVQGLSEDELDQFLRDDFTGKGDAR